MTSAPLFDIQKYCIVPIELAQRVIIFDSNNIGWRAWSAPNYGNMVLDDGRRSGHIFGFLRIIFSFLRRQSSIPTAVVFARDGHAADKFKFFPDYKGGRQEERVGDPMPDITRLIECLPGYHPFRSDSEADDMIASIVARIRKINKQRRDGSKPIRTFIVSNDHDLLQLMDEHTFLWRRAEEKAISMRQVGEILGKSKLPPWDSLLPKHVALFKALFGDSSDNIPGVPRLRKIPVIAIAARTDGTLRSLRMEIKAAVADKSISNAIADRIRTHWKLVKRNHKLTRLNRKISFPLAFQAEFDTRALNRMVIAEFGCKSLAEDINRIQVTR